MDKKQNNKHTLGTFWEMPIMLGGLYGLRMSEILGLRWQCSGRAEIAIQRRKN